uniref:hypothetical protein n=1 Tax=Thaumasiovibrio occultus TaxID=1891184 RepID=UPI000B3596DD|nr:hypothetical protein [Thaumasiovibrio occultus]
MRSSILLTLLLAPPALANEQSEVEAAIIAKSEAVTGQAVSATYSLFQITDGWALAYGSLESADGSGLDWSKLAECDHDLDKGLWAVMQQVESGEWNFVDYAACASEPPFWYIDLAAHEGPCELFEGIQREASLMMDQECRESRK